MSKYLSKTASPRVGVTCKAWEGARIMVNVKDGKAHIELDGYDSGQDIADEVNKIDTIRHNIDDITQLTNYQPLFDEIVALLTAEGLLQGATLEDVPPPSE